MCGGGKCLFVTPCRDECQLLIFTGLNKCKKTMLPNRKDWTVITKWLSTSTDSKQNCTGIFSYIKLFIMIVICKITKQMF